MINTIDIVITMGGLGSRFRKAGYSEPKYMIKAKGKTLFEWAMISLSGYKEKVYRYIFIAMKDEKYDVMTFIRDKCRELYIDKYNIILLDQLTDGQATTALYAEKYWNPNHALLIFNIDTYVEPGEMNYQQLKGDGFIPCFKAEGDHWSFVRVNSDGVVVEIKEKKRISDNCTLGAYYFKTCRLFKDLYIEYYIHNSDQVTYKEKYVAPLYDYLLYKGGEIYITDIDPKKVHVLGTPEELNTFIKET